MSIKNRIGIIGKGFVGSAVAHGFSDQTGYSTEIRIFDKNPIRSENSLEETVNQSDFIFLSVPTPASSTGQIDLSIVEEALSEIDKINKSDSNIVLLRSTVTPGTSLMLQKKFSNLRIVFNPEFLTERSALFDFINQSRVILGGDSKYTKKVKDLYKHRFGNYLPVIETNYETAELIKYMNNLFVTKVSFLNEMKLVADKTNVDWDKAMEGCHGWKSRALTPFSARTRWKTRFGGSCFPKDIQAMIAFGESIGIDMNVLNGAWKTNLNVRPEKDWENLKGRAVSSDSDD